MNSWFRSWHGAPTDPKWLAIAQRTQTNAGMVSAVFWALMDYASQASDRGDVASFDVESYAAFSGWDDKVIHKIIEAFKDKGVIKNNKLTGWEKRQPKREDGSAERSKEWRERKRTQTTAKEHREDKTREDKNKTDSGATAPAAGKPKREKKYATSLSESFEPNWEAATRVGLSRREAEREHLKFKNHAAQTARTCVNWQAAWSNWCINAAQFLKKPPPSMNGATVAATITPESRSWNAWKAHFRDNNDNIRAAMMDKCADEGRAFTVASEWPPGHEMNNAN